MVKGSIQQFDEFDPYDQLKLNSIRDYAIVKSTSCQSS